MNRRTAKLIKNLSKLSGKGERSLKREYYSLSKEEKFDMKKEMEMVLDDPGLIQQALEEAGAFTRVRIEIPPEHESTMEELVKDGESTV